MRFGYNTDMTVHDTYVTVEVGEKCLEELLTLVRDGRRVRILCAGEPVADLSRPLARRELAPVNPRLKATILVEGHEITTPEDWPDNSR